VDKEAFATTWWREVMEEFAAKTLAFPEVKYEAHDQMIITASLDDCY